MAMDIDVDAGVDADIDDDDDEEEDLFWPLVMTNMIMMMMVSIGEETVVKMLVLVMTCSAHW